MRACAGLCGSGWCRHPITRVSFRSPASAKPRHNPTDPRTTGDAGGPPEATLLAQRHRDVTTGNLQPQPKSRSGSTWTATSSSGSPWLTTAQACPSSSSSASTTSTCPASAPAWSRRAGRGTGCSGRPAPRCSRPACSLAVLADPCSCPPTLRRRSWSTATSRRWRRTGCGSHRQKGFSGTRPHAPRTTRRTSGPADRAPRRRRHAPSSHPPCHRRRS
jgi:hypothetical protein